jgi:DNA-binding transcriptional LysR family regulator
MRKLAWVACNGYQSPHPYTKATRVKTRSEELQVFVAVIDCGSISAAAEQIGQTPSAVSRTLSRLEGKLGTTLVNRTTRRMDLTEEGRFFLERSRLILEQMDDMEERLSMHRQTPSGRLRINAAGPFMLHAILPWISEFRQQYPGIELELNTDDLIIDLLEQSTDVAIRIGELADSSLHARALGCSPVQVLASPAYLARHGTPQNVEDLAEHCLLGFSARVAQPVAAAPCPGRALGDPPAIARLQWRDPAPVGDCRGRHRQPVALHDPRRHPRRPPAGAAGGAQQRLSPADPRGLLPQYPAGPAHSVLPRFHPGKLAAYACAVA